ncbi:MAG TPA: 1,4-dihydroxy-2-naphthoate polyprenyltransferase, partial [Acidimicrobiales bacterium]|nr:1,4-dihydroxy-2-naphthoate polyprenyltransferase [Acidimicrobiales bacterium]
LRPLPAPALSSAPVAAGTAPAGEQGASLKDWVAGARPRTLPAAVPVVVGTAAGWWLRPAGQGGVVWWRAAAALVVALAVQVGTNYANDYSDGVRGTDERRVGPLRLVGSGLASPGSVRLAAWLSYAVAGLAGLALAAATSWWLVPVGAACVAAGWLYTGGPRPYGYLGLGELFVFAFFGVVATVGSSYVQCLHLWTSGYHGLLALWASIPVGLLATALLEANNLRDIAGDTVSKKRTLAVRLGRKGAGWLYAGSLAGVVVGIVVVAVARPWALLALAAAPLAVRPLRATLSPAEGRELLPVLAGTGRLQLAVGILLTVGIVL